MANYTMTLDELLKWKFPAFDPSTGQKYVDITKMFPDNYNLFDNSHKEELEGKIVAHFLLREIGQETPDAFLFYFKRTFLELLPMYNNLCMAFSKNFESDFDEEFSVLSESTSHSNGTGSGTNTAKSENKETPYTNYPTGTNYNSSVNDTSASSQSQNEANTSGTSKNHGRNSSKMAIAQRIAQGYVDPDLWLIDNLDSCFMQIF